MPDLHPTLLNIVDGNAYLLDEFRKTTNGLVVRHLLDKVNALKVPPVFVFDGAGGNRRRRALLPVYKTKRTPPGESLFDSIRLFCDALKHLPSVQVRVPTWEADDVISTIALSYASRGETVSVVTVDRDLYQLAAHPNVKVTASYEHVPPHLVRLYKTFVGDPSDGITGIPLFGEVAWTKLDQQAALRLMTSRQRDVAVIEALGMKPKQTAWLIEHFDEALVMWDVVGLLTVPMDEIQKHLIVGTRNLTAMNAVLKEFML